MSLSLDKKHILSKIGQTNSLHELESVRLEYLGKKGIIPSEMKSLTNLEIEQKKIRGQELNTIKQIIEIAIIEKKQNIENKQLNEKIKKEKIDVTLPPSLTKEGKIHPISQAIFNVIQICKNFNNIEYSLAYRMNFTFFG
jgi:phenylalanyl-tRNA synthetase alpha chain